MQIVFNEKSVKIVLRKIVAYNCVTCLFMSVKRVKSVMGLDFEKLLCQVIN